MSIGFSLVPGNAIASAVFVEQEFKKTGVSGPIPQKIAFLAQYNTGKTPTNNVGIVVTSADEVASLAGRGSMAHLMAIKLFQNIGAGTPEVTWFPLAAGTGAATGGTITASGTASSAVTISLYSAGKKISVAVTSGLVQNDIATAIAAAINADLDLPVTASATTNVVTLTPRWVGLSANGIKIQKDLGSTDAANEPGTTTITIAALAGGSADPDISTALANFGDTWYTWVVCPYNADASCLLLEAAGVARRNPGDTARCVECVE